MKTLIWRKNEKPKERKLQYDLIENNKYEGDIVIGTIWLSYNNEWLYETKDNWDSLDADSLEEAKKEFKEIMKEHYLDELDYFQAGIEEIKEYLDLLWKL